MSAYQCHGAVRAAGFAEFVCPMRPIARSPKEPLALVRFREGAKKLFNFKVREDGRTVRAGRGELFNALYLKNVRARRRAGCYRHRAKREENPG